LFIFPECRTDSKILNNGVTIDNQKVFIENDIVRANNNHNNNNNYNNKSDIIINNTKNESKESKDTNDLDECLVWIDRIMEYKRIHGCIPIIDTKFDNINTKYSDYYKVDNIDYYKTYNIGRFPKSSTDFRTMDIRMEGVIWYGNWKTFWSYQHPRCWKNLSSQEIIDDILGL
jgi:hypothetical protein